MSTPAASPTPPDSPIAGRDDRFPPGIPYIVGNEGAERFSFYGMRQILYIYLTSLFIGFAAESTVAPDALTQAKVHATQITHLFNAGVYLFPMIGAILADRLLGKYRVIFWVSLVYCAGQAALAFGGSAGSAGNLSLAQTAVFAGLILISLGSGGIKPCVSANVGDQFTTRNAHLVTRIFQIFYFIINFGSFFATLLTPWLFKHYGPKWAFGVPGVLMALATAVFWFGRRKFVRVPPKPGGKLGLMDFLASSLLATPLLVLVAVGAAVAEEVVRAAMSDQTGAVLAALGHIAHGYWPHALGAAGGFGLGVVLFMARQQIQQDTGFFAVLLYCWRRRGDRRPDEDFWTPARVRFGDEAAEGPPAVLRIIVVFSMVSVFWALFDQHSSTWVEQAKAMNLTLTVPVIFWYGWVVPAVVFGALFGALWLFLWVANRAMPRWLRLGFPCLLGVWGLVALALQSGVGLPALGQLAAACGQAEFGRQIAQGGMSTITLLPAQIAGFNPLMVMIIIPLLNVLVYQPLERRNRPLKPLHRMTIGMFLASLAFVAVALLQARIQAAGRGEVHVLWQIIPFLILTISEVLVSVTGLEFAYTQAPRAMKSTIMGFWLLCVTFGNVLVAFLAPLETLSLATFFWVFAGLMAAAAAVFAVLAAGYKGRSYLQHA
jgi:dipeptide/tripeptide permease